MLQLSSVEQRETLSFDGEVFLNSTKEAIKQVLELIALVGDKYSDIPTFAGAPIGKHIRHIIDHFWAYQKGIECGEIDYSLRHRDSETESMFNVAIVALTDFQTWIEKHPPTNANILVKTEIAISEKTSATVVSNQYRELAFVIGHTYHHLAYANLLAKTMSIETPDHIGIAPATASYLRESKNNQG